MKRYQKVSVQPPRGAAYPARYIGKVTTHNGVWLEVLPLDTPKGAEPRRVRPATVSEL